VALNDITRDAVEKAVAEYDRIGEDEFLTKYKFAQSLDYWLVIGDKRYVSKAIVWAAHGYLDDEIKPLIKGKFSGGRDTVMKCLERLGFEVTKPERSSLAEIMPGVVLSNKQLYSAFGLANTGGMRRNKSAHYLVLISDPFKGLYQERWEDGVLHYTGMGKIGDQSITGTQNKTLATSPVTGV
jgi:hypothetical protein